MSRLFIVFVMLCALTAMVAQAENLRGAEAESTAMEAESDSTDSLFQRVSRRLQKFNRFRSYQNAAVRPISYSKVSRPHAVSEYLSPTQKYMVANQKRDIPSNMYDNSWSGFEKGK